MPVTMRCKWKHIVLFAIEFLGSALPKNIRSQMSGSRSSSYQKHIKARCEAHKIILETVSQICATTVQMLHYKTNIKSSLKYTNN